MANPPSSLHPHSVPMPSSAAPTSPPPLVPDWHQPGIWAAFDASGNVLPDTVADTPYSTRSSLVLAHNLLWSKAVAKGYVIRELTPGAQMDPGPLRQF